MLFFLSTAILAAVPSRADIFRWDNGQVIPGTEGITPGPRVQLDHRQLDYARLNNREMTGINFEESNFPLCTCLHLTYAMRT